MWGQRREGGCLKSLGWDQRGGRAITARLGGAGAGHGGGGVAHADARVPHIASQHVATHAHRITAHRHARASCCATVTPSQPPPPPMRMHAVQSSRPPLHEPPRHSTQPQPIATHACHAHHAPPSMSLLATTALPLPGPLRIFRSWISASRSPGERGVGGSGGVFGGVGCECVWGGGWVGAPLLLFCHCRCHCRCCYPPCCPSHHSPTSSGFLRANAPLMRDIRPPFLRGSSEMGGWGGGG